VIKKWKSSIDVSVWLLAKGGVAGGAGRGGWIKAVVLCTLLVMHPAVLLHLCEAVPHRLVELIFNANTKHTFC
jgi:hypothetical protein